MIRHVVSQLALILTGIGDIRATGPAVRMDGDSLFASVPPTTDDKTGPALALRRALLDPLDKAHYTDRKLVAAQISPRGGEEVDLD